MHPLANIAVAAARAAGDFIIKNFDRTDKLVIEKKGRSDFVTQVDRGAEQRIVEHIRKYYPDHAILAEEGGAQGQSDVQWIIDPLDGTTNFLHGLPHFAVSIGISVKGKLEHGVIYAPCTQDLYVASKGGGATLNNRKMRISQTKDMEHALIGTGVPIGKPEMLEKYLPMFANVANATSGVRRAGAAALDLAYVAAGRLDAFFEMNLKPWDIAAGIVLVQEAGGMVRELYGEKNDVIQTGHILAGNAKIWPALSTLLHSDPA